MINKLMKKQQRKSETYIHHHFRTLDSLRGLAAFSVVIHHLAYAVPDQIIHNFAWLYQGPFRFLISGRPAVILFFVISGFVLTLSLEAGTSYGVFLIRRFFRIYVPFVLMIAVATFLVFLIKPQPVSWLSDWFNQASWAEPLTSKLVIDHLAMVGNYIGTTLNPVIWTLIYELRISLVFPLLYFIFKDRSFFFAVVVGTIFSLFCDLLLVENNYSLKQIHFSSNWVEGILGTCHFVYTFILGLAVAIHREQVTMWLARWQNRLGHYFVLIVLVGIMAGIGLFVTGIGDFGLDIASAIIVTIVALAPGIWQSVLSSRPLIYLGKISYSLYLTHMVVFLAIAHSWPFAPPLLALLFMLQLGLFITIADIFCRLIEMPSNRLGRSLTRTT
jgi:peptidoglycan/LPS O-acetylase OafA/YrhL